MSASLHWSRQIRGNHQQKELQPATDEDHVDVTNDNGIIEVQFMLVEIYSNELFCKTTN